MVSAKQLRGLVTLLEGVLTQLLHWAFSSVWGWGGGGGKEGGGLFL
jgi:hypothetical protein